MSVQTLKRQARIRDIPPGWKLTTVGGSCKIRNDLRKPISVGERRKIEGNYPYYGPTGILSYIQEYLVEGTFALIGEDGDHFLKFETKDQTLLVHGRFNVNNHAHLIEATKDCSAEWFFYYFQHRNITPFLTRQGVGRYKLNKDALQKLPILLPPAYQQTLIVNLLFTWDAAIKKTGKLIAAKLERRKGLMQQLLSGKHRFPGFRKPWQQVRLGEVFSNRTESGRTDLPLVSITGSEGVVFRDGLKRKDTSSTNKGRYLRICPGDIGYNTMRMWQGVNGLSQIEGIVSPAYTIVTPDDSLVPEFMALLFKFPPIVHLFYRYSQGLVSDTWNLKFRHFSEIRVRVPEKQEQEAIAAIFRPLDKELSLLHQQLDAFKEQKKGLMQKLLTGIWHVRAGQDMCR